MTNEPSSPPCSSAGADDSYTVYASRDELVAALDELLEAERAGARVALASSKAMQDERFSGMMGTVRRDEARWCAMLARQIRRIGCVPSRKTGAFYGKAMDIEDPRERTIFLNRGQAWVVRKLETLLPRVRDDLLRAQLHKMADSHRANIAFVESVLREAG